MIFWLDAHLSPAIASWLTTTFPEHTAIAIRDLGLRDADDTTIFLKAKDEKAIVITKDNDFASLIDYFGPPPQVIWLRCGNTSNAVLRILLEKKFDEIISLIKNGASIIEIRDKE